MFGEQTHPRARPGPGAVAVWVGLLGRFATTTGRWVRRSFPPALRGSPQRTRHAASRTELIERIATEEGLAAVAVADARFLD
jgi:hypothetical protein